jgi:hypothetical protein
VSRACTPKLWRVSLGSLVHVLLLKAHTSETNIQDRDAGEVGTGAATRARGGGGLGREASAVAVAVALSYGVEAALRRGCGRLRGRFHSRIGWDGSELGYKIGEERCGIRFRRGGGGRRGSQIGCGVREVR